MCSSDLLKRPVGSGGILGRRTGGNSRCDNNHMDRYSLPHGAKGIEGEGFAISLSGDKIVFISRSRSESWPAEVAEKEKHYTLHAGPASGVLDLHETTLDADGQEQHRTLFALRRDDLPAILGEFAPMLQELVDLIRPLRLGWLKHNNISIARGVNPVSDEDIAAVTRKRKRRLALDIELYERNVFVPEYLEDVYDFPDGNFALFYRGCQIGIGFKHTIHGGDIRLFWIKLGDLLHVGEAWREEVIGAFTKAAIPPERYVEYPFLRA